MGHCASGINVAFRSGLRTLLEDDKDLIAIEKSSFCLLGNGIGIRKYFKEWKIKAYKMIKMKAFSHWFEREGMEFQQIETKHEEMRVLLDRYEECLEAEHTWEEDDDYEDTDDE